MRAMYDEGLVAPMRAELTRAGVEELRTPEDVDARLGEAGTTLVVVNSVCGCAARVYRVGLLMYGKKPTIRELARWIRYA